MTCLIQIAQINLLVGDVSGNAARVIASARQARAAGADLVVFPELTLTGYPPEDLLLRRELMERVESALVQVCEQTRGITLVLGYPRTADGGLFNMAGVIRDGALAAEYAKQELPNYSVFDEKRYFQPGTAPVVFEHRGLRLGLSVCEDIWQDGPTTRAARAGAQVLLNINASPFHAGKQAEREALVSRRARDNALTILYANLVGGQDELVFDGGSFVAGRDGQVHGRSPRFEEHALLVGLADDGSPDIITAAESAPAAAAGESAAAVYNALVLGVRDYVRKNGFKGAVLGLSGGVDSALTLAIAVDALGADQVEAVLMPSRYTASMSNEDALEQARRQGVQTQVIPIEPAFRSFLSMLEPAFAGRAPDVTEENIQARCRGVILMALSNKRGRILLTTGNKSEMAVGYATLYGDMAGGFAPIKDCPKTLVYRLAAYRNGIAPIIPERVLTRAPSAELRPDQTDQDSLPAYEVLDPILRLYIEEDQGIDAIVAQGFDEAVVRKVTRLVDRNEYKRRQAPPGVRISGRAFGRDRRYPITSGF